MAAETSVENVALKVADGVHEFAKSRRLSPKDYRIFMVVNTQFSRLRVTLFSKVFRDRSPEQEMRDYDDVSDAIDERLGADRDYFTYIGLILTPDEEHARERGMARGSFEFEVDERLINRSKGGTKASHRGPSRSD
jgi:hypothetical protein